MNGLLHLRYTALLLAAVLLPACQTMGADASVAKEMQPPAQTDRLAVDVPEAWGGQIRCTAAYGCRVVAVEHEANKVVLHQIAPDGRSSRLLDKQPLAHHPDSAIWLEDDLVVAAVEATNSLDVYRIEGERLHLVQRIEVGIPPRDVTLVGAGQGRYQMLATPYSGKEVVWVDYVFATATGRPGAAKIARSTWCEAPWHPVRVDRAPGAPSGGVAVACLDDKRVLFVPGDNVLGEPRVLFQVPGEERVVTRQARVSPSGRWLYVAMELGGERNVRIDMDSGAFEWIAAPVQSASSVLPIADDLVIWGFDTSLYLQKLGPQAQVLETRWLKINGFAADLQWQDVNGDGVPDLVIFNSIDLPDSKAGVEIIYGPVWERAQVR